jgi:uncharacterized cupredoxin-like copper-binding protein
VATVHARATPARRGERFAFLAAVAAFVLVTVACGAPPGSSSDADGADRTVEVRATDRLAFEPPAIDVAVGETIHFVVSNPGATEHDFMLGTRAQHRAIASDGGHGMGGHGEPVPVMGHDGMMHGSGSAMDAIADMPPSEMPGAMLPPGSRGELIVTFDEAGTFEYACHVAGHYEAGMRGTITVS